MFFACTSGEIMWNRRIRTVSQVMSRVEKCSAFLDTPLTRPTVPQNDGYINPLIVWMMAVALGSALGLGKKKAPWQDVSVTLWLRCMKRSTWYAEKVRR